jgi:NADH:ubiquinone oxidoreductase subunit F (NADH-binding)
VIEGMAIGGFVMNASVGYNMEIFEGRVLGENLSFWLKNHKF